MSCYTCVSRDEPLPMGTSGKMWPHIYAVEVSECREVTRPSTHLS